MTNENLNPKTLAESLQLLLKAKGTTQELLAMTKAYSSALGNSVSSMVKLSDSLKEQTDLSERLLKQSNYVGLSLDKRLQLQKLSSNLEESAYDIVQKEAQVRADLLLKQTMLKTGLIDVYAEQAKNYALAKELGYLSDEDYEKKIASLKQQQHANEHLYKQLELTESLAKWQLELNEELEKYEMGWEKIKSKIKAIVTDPKVAKAVFLTTMAEKAGEVYESFEKLNQSGLSLGQRIDYMTKGFSLMSLAGLSDTKGVLDGMNETFGSLNGLTSSEVDHLGHLAKSMGVTGQEALALVENFSKLPGETMETATHTADFVQHLAKANGVAPGKITKEIAKNTELIAVGGYRGAKAFAEAAMKAQKMGVELSTTAKVMNSLLNFEDSINKQMEASVLLGREINLDKARELALNGKSVEATQEILRNVGGQAAFEKMNVLQKQALAAAAGMTVEELQKGLDAQIETNKYSGEQTSDLKERLGLVTEVGGGIVGFFKEYGLAILAATQLMSTLKLQKLGVLALDKVSSLFSKNQLANTQAQVVAEEELLAAKKASAGGSFLGAGAAAAVGPMLAFGAAVLMVGAGIGIAALGMSKLVESFSGLGDAAGPAAEAVLGLSLGFAIMVPSLALLATASTAATPALYALGVAVLLIGGGIAIASLGLAKMAESSKGLTDIGDALVNMGTGLSSIASNGYKALPIFTALTGLASVAPALSTLGEAFGGPKVGKEEKTDKMDVLISEVKALKEVLNKGGGVYMDTRKVGEALRLYGYTTKV